MLDYDGNVLENYSSQRRMNRRKEAIEKGERFYQYTERSEQKLYNIGKKCHKYYDLKNGNKWQFLGEINSIRWNANLAYVNQRFNQQHRA